MYAYITISNVGADAGPFNLYSDVDGYTSAFETNIPTSFLEAGYATDLVPDGTLEVRVKSANELCGNFVNVGVIALEYYFEPSIGSYMVDWYENGSTTYVYGYFSGYFNGSYSVPGNLLVKLNSDRSVDESFNIGEGFNFGIVYNGATIFKQPDGKLILSGFYNSFNGQSANGIIRLNTDGSRDTTFNSGTGFSGYTTNIGKDSSGNLYITGIFSLYDGQYSPRLVRLLSDGSKDPTFNVGTGFNNTGISILTNLDDTLYVTGYFTTYNGLSAPSIIKLKPDATKDTSFNPGTGFNTGWLPVLLARISGQSNFYCAGYFTTYNSVNQPHIVKLMPDGSVDPSFNAGTGFNGDVGLLKIVWNNKLYVGSGEGGPGGEFTTYNGVVTYGNIILNEDGTIFHSFGANYKNVFIIGNLVFGNIPGQQTQVIYTYVP